MAGGHKTAHKGTHEDAGDDTIDLTAISGVCKDTQVPSAHKLSHQFEGTDEMSIAGLSGESATPQVPKMPVTGAVKATPDEITATSDGVAASISTMNTEVTTNGDSDEDNVTLANGTSGQIKNIYCVVAGNVADSFKITPLSMVGGTQITFAANPSGKGCTLVYADNEGWIVVGNNGGAIT